MEKHIYKPKPMCRAADINYEFIRKSERLNKY